MIGIKNFIKVCDFNSDRFEIGFTKQYHDSEEDENSLSEIFAKFARQTVPPLTQIQSKSE